MKTTRDAGATFTKGSMRHQVRILLAAAVGVGHLSGCSMFFGGSSPKMSSSPAIPAAESTVRFARTTNDNTNIELKVKHLAHPDKLSPPGHIYVVWLRGAPNAAPQNIGALSVDKNLTGTLKTVTSLRSFGLFITAEASGQVQQPTGQPLLWTDHSE